MRGFTEKDSQGSYLKGNYKIPGVFQSLTQLALLAICSFFATFLFAP